MVSHRLGTRLGFLSDGSMSKHLKGVCVCWGVGPEGLESEAEWGPSGDQWDAQVHPLPCGSPWVPVITVHDLLVAPGPAKWDEGQAASGCGVQGHPDAPEIHGHPKSCLLGLAKHRPLVQVRVLPPRNQRAVREGEGARA